MSRSYKKHPCITWTCKSNKKDKKIANKKFRRLSRYLIKKGKEPKHLLKEVSNPWSFAGDGLAQWKTNLDKKFLRK